MARAGFHVHLSSRGYKPYVNDDELELRLVRPQEMSRFVAQGFLDFGITGKDWILESGHDVEVLCDLQYSKVTSLPARWVIAVAENSSFKTVKDLAGKRIATELVETTKRYLASHGVEAQVEFSWGATEVKVPELVDAIVDLTETGSSLAANHLRVIDTIVESYPQLIANKGVFADSLSRRKLESFKTLLIGALNARDKVGLKMNVPKVKLEEFSSQLPALRNPTISHLANPDWAAIEIIVDTSVVRDLIPRLKELGAEGIIEYPLNKVVY
jgi:ATP phosphoribosyltransferase